jgi:hypothetical protein
VFLGLLGLIFLFSSLCHAASPNDSNLAITFYSYGVEVRTIYLNGQKTTMDWGDSNTTITAEIMPDSFSYCHKETEGNRNGVILLVSRKFSEMFYFKIDYSYIMN